MLVYLLTGSDSKSLLNKAIELWSQPLKASGHPDFLLFPEDRSASSIGIGDVRKLIKALQLKPIKAETKLVVIQNAHLLTVEAQNALLKTLEEPPKQVQLILTTSQPNALLPTILSRVIRTRVTRHKSMIDNTMFIFEKDFSKQLISLLREESSLRLIQTPIIAKDRDSARKFVLQCLNYFHMQLINQTSNVEALISLTKLEKINVLRLLTKIINSLNSNTHPQLTIDNLLLRLPRL